MKYLTRAQVAHISWYEDLDDYAEDWAIGLAEYIDEVIGYLHTAMDSPPERAKPYRIKQQIAAGNQPSDAWFMATQLITGLSADRLAEQWHPSKVPDINRELHNAVRVLVAEYCITPSRTKDGDLARLVALILNAAGLLDDDNSEIPRNIVRAALADLH